MDESDPVFDEPRATGWLRTRLFGDEETAAGFVQHARSLLGQLRSMTGVNARIASGEPGGFFRAQRLLADGTLLEAITNDGLDEIRITAAPPPGLSLPEQPFTPPEPPPGERHAAEPIPLAPRATSTITLTPHTWVYCLWQPDNAAYTPVLNGRRIYGPVGLNDGTLYMGGLISGQVENSMWTPETVFYSYAVNPKDETVLDVAGTLPLDAPPAYGARMLHYDESTDRCYVLDMTPGFHPYAQTDYGLTSFSPTSAPARTMLDQVYGWDGHLYEDYSDAMDGGSVAGIIPLNRVEVDGAGLWSLNTVQGTQSYLGPVEAGYVMGGGITPGGDALVIFGSNPSLYRDIVRTGTINRTYPLPTGEGIYPDSTFLVCQNDETTVWIAMTIYVEVSPRVTYQRVFQWAIDPNTGAGFWQEVTVDGGWAVRNTDNDIYAEWTVWGGGLTHDSITDAVAVLMADGSGVWIFNARDCLDQPMPEFFYPFANRPDVATYPSTRVTQFYDGTLYVRFEAVPSTATDADHKDARDCIGAVYTIGQLKQLRMEDDIGPSADIATTFDPDTHSPFPAA